MALRQKSLSKLSEVDQQEDRNKPASTKKRSVASPTPRTRKVRVVSAVPSLKAITAKSVQADPSALLDPEVIAAHKVEEAKKTLGNLESEVISALFPASGPPQSLEDIATKLGMNVQEVKDIADNALRGLRGPKTLAPRVSTVWN